MKMKQIKKGDVLLIVGYDSVILEDLFVEEVDRADDMNDKNACPIGTTSGWHVVPGDLFLVRECDVDGLPPIQTARVEKQIERRGFWWELRLKHIQPRRSK